MRFTVTTCLLLFTTVNGFSFSDRKWKFLLPQDTMKQLLDLDRHAARTPIAVDKAVDSILSNQSAHILEQLQLPPFYSQLPFMAKWQIKEILYDKMLPYDEKHKLIREVIFNLPDKSRKFPSLSADDRMARHSRYFEAFNALQYKVTFNFKLSEMKSVLSDKDYENVMDVLTNSTLTIEEKTSQIDQIISRQPYEVLDQLFFTNVPIVDAEVRERFRRLLIEKSFWRGRHNKGPKFGPKTRADCLMWPWCNIVYKADSKKNAEKTFYVKQIVPAPMLKKPFSVTIVKPYFVQDKVDKQLKEDEGQDKASKNDVKAPEVNRGKVENTVEVKHLNTQSPIFSNAQQDSNIKMDKKTDKKEESHIKTLPLIENPRPVEQKKKVLPSPTKEEYFKQIPIGEGVKIHFKNVNDKKIPVFTVFKMDPFSQSIKVNQEASKPVATAPSVPVQTVSQVSIKDNVVPTSPQASPNPTPIQENKFQLKIAPVHQNGASLNPVPTQKTNEKKVPTNNEKTEGFLDQLYFKEHENALKWNRDENLKPFDPQELTVSARTFKFDSPQKSGPKRYEILKGSRKWTDTDENKFLEEWYKHHGIARDQPIPLREQDDPVTVPLKPKENPDHHIDSRKQATAGPLPQAKEQVVNGIHWKNVKPTATESPVYVEDVDEGKAFEAKKEPNHETVKPPTVVIDKESSQKLVVHHLSNGSSVLSLEKINSAELNKTEMVKKEDPTQQPLNEAVDNSVLEAKHDQDTMNIITKSHLDQLRDVLEQLHGQIKQARAYKP
ncbi:unnamed protein product [Bursaphelenchus okinawaensis]|uniref:Uncharacterized protein n=1 Tax=Bursaphelenchus okinawaensis TaxID=465554 RepID=A0A811L9U7_9BILA|nr:unnamed protein product [Bursaphelenchus okinawaensis]CAG9119161.1 unnamed protein product [Bursaphelenchus okinawaensis]